MKQLSKDPFAVAFEDENYDEDLEEEPKQLPQQPPEEEEEEEEGEEKSSPPPPSQPPSSSSSQPPPPPQQKTHESPIHRPNDDDDEEDDEDEVMVDDTQTNPSTSKAVDVDDDDELRGSETQNNKTQINNNNNNNNNNKKKRKLNQSGGEKSKEDEEEEEEENMDVELGKLSATGDPDKMAKMQAILSQFTEEQMSRYESFRRSGFQKANMKKLLASITGSPKISIPMTIVVSGIAKMFVGELVEAGRMIMTERGETGPIRPCHIREAYRRLKLEGKVPKKSVPRLFR